MDRGWLFSGYSVYSAAMHYSTGGKLAAATLRVADRAVSSRQTEPQMANQVGSYLLPAGVMESEWTVDRRNCHLACMGRRHDGCPH